MEHFLLGLASGTAIGLFTGIAMMLVRDVPQFAWHQPRAFWNLLQRLSNPIMTFGICLVIAGGLVYATYPREAVPKWLFGAPYGRYVAGAMFVIGALLQVLFVVVGFIGYTVGKIKPANEDQADQRGTERAHAKSKSVPYQPRFPRRRP